MSTGRRAAAVALLAIWTSRCASDQTPSPPPLSLVLPATVEGRYTTCTTCTNPATTVVLEFAVTVRDAAGPGGTLERLETVVMNRSRQSEVGRNVRPNADHPIIDTRVPAHAELVVQAGVVFPPPPPRDEITVTVQVRLTDGRQASGTAPVTVVLPALMARAEGGQTGR